MNCPKCGEKMTEKGNGHYCCPDCKICINK